MRRIDKDLNTISELCEADEDKFFKRIGVIAGPGGAAQLEIGSFDGAWIREFAQTMFKGADGRIALVYVDSGSPIAGIGGWLSAALKCSGDIVGVLVLGRSAGGFAHDCGDAAVFLSRIPQKFWDGALPVLFDESGLIEDLSPNSPKVEVPSNLSFDEPTKQFGEHILQLGKWRRGAYPIWDVTGCAEQDEFICLKIQSTFDDAAARVRQSMIVVAHPENVVGIIPGTADFSDVCRFMERAVPGSVKQESLEAFGSFDEIRERAAIAHAEPCCVVLNVFEVANADPDLFDKMREVESAVHRMVNVAHLIHRAFSDYNAYYAGDCDDLDQTAEDFRRLCDAFGINEQMKALDAGVPFDDIIA